MSSIGPQLPKRKRSSSPTSRRDASPKHPRHNTLTNNNEEIDLDSDSDSSLGPAPPPTSKPLAGSLLPQNNDEIDLPSDSDSDTGPAPPPQLARPQPQSRLTAIPTAPLNDDASSSEDDYGPSLPSTRTIGPSLPPAQEEEAAPQRDTWMLAPPTSTSYSERDPTRLRARKFASKPSAKPAPGTDSGLPSIWTETPEEKLKRLQDSVLGRSSGTTDGAGASVSKKKREEEERDRLIAASIEAQRGQSLYNEHNQKRKEKGVPKAEEEDDPSKRGFDREKDMALGGKIGTAKRRELVNKSANFGGRFQKGSYL